MTKVIVNEMLKSMSGRYGEKHVFRDFAGNTIVAKRPTLNGESSVGQEAHRGFFREAIKYATFTKDDPAKWAKYVSRHVPGRSAFNLAVSDFMCPPVIEQIDASQYMGHVGDKIIVTAVDKFEVTGVEVRITGHDGTLIEEGVALRHENTSFYAYVSTRENSTRAGTVLTVTASDNPGHSVTATETL